MTIKMNAVEEALMLLALAECCNLANMSHPSLESYQMARRLEGTLYAYLYKHGSPDNYGLISPIIERPLYGRGQKLLERAAELFNKEGFDLNINEGLFVDGNFPMAEDVIEVLDLLAPSEHNKPVLKAWADTMAAWYLEDSDADTKKSMKSFDLYV